MYTIIQKEDALVVTGDGEPVDLWDSLRHHYLAIRPARRGAGGLRYPLTTNADALALVGIFNRELAAAPRDVSGVETEAAIWRRAAKRITKLAAGASADTFTDNAGLWLRDVKRLAVYLSVARYLPTRAEMLDDLAQMTRHAPAGGAP